MSAIHRIARELPDETLSVTLANENPESDPISGPKFNHVFTQGRKKPRTATAPPAATHPCCIFTERIGRDETVTGCMSLTVTSVSTTVVGMPRSPHPVTACRDTPPMRKGQSALMGEVGVRPAQPGQAERS